MPFDGISVVLDSLGEVASLHIHSFNSVPTLLLLQLVSQGLLHADSFEVEERDETLVLASVAHDMVGISSIVIHVNLMTDHITHSTHLHL